MSDTALQIVTVPDDAVLDVGLEVVPVALIVVHGRTIQSLNQAAERLFGYARTEVHGAPFERLVPAAPRSLQTATVVRDLVGIRKDGSLLGVQITIGSPATTGGLSVVAVEETSDQRRAEARLRGVIEAAPTAMILVNREGRLALANAQAERLFGYSRQELLGQSVEKLLPARFRQLHVRQRDGYLAGPTARSMGAGRDLFGVRKDGTEIPIEIGLSPLRDGAGDHVLAAIIDISERKRAEKLRRMGAEFGQRALSTPEPSRLAKEAARLVARVLDVRFVRISEVNATRDGLAVIAGTGWPSELLEGHQLKLGPQAAETLRTGQPVLGGLNQKFGLCNEAMSQAIIASASVPIRTKDAIVGVLHVASNQERTFPEDDVSFLLNVGTILGMAFERVRREAQIADLNAELQHRFEESQAFSYSVAHDLRAPLRAVAGFASALEEDFAADLNEEAKRYIKLIVASADQMGHLIDALLSLARLSRQELMPSDVDLSAIAHSIIDDLRVAESDRSVDVTIAPNVKAVGDAALLRTLLQNLLGNAWKFTRGREPAVIAFEAHTVDGQPAFCVRDNGVGFSTERPAELFAPFKRLHGKAFEGTGIGLATVARIVKRHGGRVWAESEPGSGSTFHFSLGLEPG